jgi:hypothetical protein
LAVAAKNSPQRTLGAVGRREFTSWIEALPAKDKDKLLVRIGGGEEAKVRMELQARFDQQRGASQTTATPKPRLLRELLATAGMHPKGRFQKEQEGHH